VGFYLVSVALLLPLIPTADLSENVSPIVAALHLRGIGWAGTAINVVLITAILSTMMAAMFGLGRMMRSLADEGLAPFWLKDKKDVPYRGILASGAAMLLALGLGLLLPRVYLFLISSGGFALLFTYVVIMATHIRFRKKNGCPPDGKCQMWGFPYTSLFVLLALIGAIASMPFVPGQASGLIAGGIIVALFSAGYWLMKVLSGRKHTGRRGWHEAKPGFSVEIAKELTTDKKADDKGSR
jgi:L-asparagine transporter-like permease